MNGVEDSTNFPAASSSGAHENIAVERSSMAHGSPQVETQAQDSHELNTMYDSHQEFAGGMTKILPSNIDVSVVLLNAHIYVAFSRLTKKDLQNCLAFVVALLFTGICIVLL